MRLFYILLIALLFILFPILFPFEASAKNTLIHVPKYTDGVFHMESGIFWYGKVYQTENYTDVRIGYTDTELYMDAAIFDRRLWHKKPPDLNSLDQWDAVILYLDTGIGKLYKIVGMQSRTEDRTGYQAVYTLINGVWEKTDLIYTERSRVRGNPNDDENDRGWRMTYHIPFSSFGLSTPQNGTIWKIAMQTIDVDDGNQTIIDTKSWPEEFDAMDKGTWNELSFGVPIVEAPEINNESTVTIREGLNFQRVTDTHVGGHSNCGSGFGPDYFVAWGEANYAGYEQMNIQNQFDIADWPCFSKYYVTFPLDLIPRGKVISEAQVTLHLFGNAGNVEGDATPSNVQAGIAQGSFSEPLVNWNNAPLIRENLSYTTVFPDYEDTSWPGVPYTWDVIKGAKLAYQENNSLTLVFYSTESAYHSGKYFSTSDTGDWNAVARPTLTITYGDDISTPTPTPVSTVPGDANGDGKVDGLDYVVWLNNYNTNTTGGASKGDFDGNGRVDGLDYVIWLNNYGTTPSPTSSPVATPTSMPTITPTSTPHSGSLITDLQINDIDNAVDWSIQPNMQVQNAQYGDRSIKMMSISEFLLGSEWIRTANDSKSYLGTVATFKLNDAATVYVAHDDRINQKPSWMSGYTDTGMEIINNESTPRVFSVYSRPFIAGSTVTLGENGGTASMYTVIVK